MNERRIATRSDAARPARIPAVLATGMFICALAQPAFGYVGPGAGLGVLAALFAVVVAVLATVVGLVLWPLRKLSQRRKARAAESVAKTDSPSQ
jgi:hypothetical protein